MCGFNSAIPSHFIRGYVRPQFRHSPLISFAGMAELADAPDLGSGIFRCAGSSPVTRTKIHLTALRCQMNFHTDHPDAEPLRCLHRIALHGMVFTKKLLWVQSKVRKPVTRTKIHLAALRCQMNFETQHLFYIKNHKIKRLTLWRVMPARRWRSINQSINLQSRANCAHCFFPVIQE